jgi:DNA-binding PadR family transcriptional regulator
MNPDGNGIEKTAPLTPAMFHVMLALADGETHGYAILKEVEENTGGEVTLSTGTLYGIIKRLLGDGMIEESRQRRPAPGEDSRRRYYRLTRRGQRVAVAEAERMEKVLAMARGKRLLRQLRTT